MIAFPKFNAGEGIADWSAKQLQAMSDAAMQAANLSVGRGLLLTRTGNGMRIDLAARPMGSSANRVRALVIKEVEEGDETIVCRRVVYSTIPPTLGDDPEYNWVGSEFVAWPALGLEVEDFAPLFWSPIEDGLPKLESPFIDVAKREDKIWQAEPVAKSNFMEVVIRTKDPESVGQVLEVSPVAYNEDGSPIILPFIEDMLTRSGLLVRDYWQLAMPFGTDVTPATNFPMAYKVGRFWRVSQEFKDAVFPEETNFRMTECRPLTVPQP